MSQTNQSISGISMNLNVDLSSILASIFVLRGLNLTVVKTPPVFSLRFDVNRTFRLSNIVCVCARVCVNKGLIESVLTGK